MNNVNRLRATVWVLSGSFGASLCRPVAAMEAIDTVDVCVCVCVGVRKCV